MTGDQARAPARSRTSLRPSVPSAATSPAATLPATARERFLRLAPGGPDEMGREMAAGPRAVAATLAGIDSGAAAGESVRATVAAASRIVLIGTGASLAMARTAAPAWRQQERRRAGGPHAGSRPARAVIVRESTEAVFAEPDGEAFGPGDVVIAVSQSGTSPETVAAAIRAVEAGADLVAVTAHGASAVTEPARQTVLLRIDEEQGAATQSELATLAALLRLGGAFPPGMAPETLVTWLDGIVQSWGDVEEDVAALAVAGHTWIVGLGATSGLAHAGGLLWHEKVHRETAWGSVSEFRHGQVEAVGPGDAVLVLVPPAASPDLESYLALLGRELAELHASALWLDSGTLRPPVPAELPAEAGLVGMLLRLQQLARGTAHAAGTYVDGFRVLRRVVRAAPPRFG